MAVNHFGNTSDLEVLVDLEQQFYDAGYQDGLAHGKIHGRIEGRELGREKGFEMWEELGFYEGFAKLWKAASEQKDSKYKTSRTFHNAELLLDLIARFPTENPSNTDSADLDIPKLFGQIHARYKMLCSTIGIKPSPRTSQAHAHEGFTISSMTDEDKSLLAQPEQDKVWRIEAAQKSGNVDYSF